MKKNFNFVLIISVLAVLMSCKNEPIFYSIEQEINLNDPVVLGTIYTITEAGGTLYAANGLLFSKSSSDRGWEQEKKPDGFIIRTASDNTHVYALNSDNILYSSPLVSPLSWTKIDESAQELFDNNALNSLVKKAFITKADGAYALENGSFGGAVTSGNASKDSLTAEYINGQTYFSSSILFTSNRETMLYRVSESGIEYSSDNTNWRLVSITITNPMSLEFYKNAAGSSLFTGTKTGIRSISVTNSIPSATVVPVPGANSDSCFGQSEIPFIFAYPLGEGCVYVSSMKTDNSKNTKFWAYYPSRDNWNLE